MTDSQLKEALVNNIMATFTFDQLMELVRGFAESTADRTLLALSDPENGDPIARATLENTLTEWLERQKWSELYKASDVEGLQKTTLLGGTDIQVEKFPSVVG